MATAANSISTWTVELRAGFAGSVTSRTGFSTTFDIKGVEKGGASLEGTFTSGWAVTVNGGYSQDPVIAHSFKCEKRPEEVDPELGDPEDHVEF